MRKRITIMQAAMLALFIGLFSAYAFANPYDWKVTRAVDGDTVEIQVSWLPVELGDKLKIRVFGVDTPEKGFRAKCDSEAKRGEAATQFTKKMLADGKKIQMEIYRDWETSNEPCIFTLVKGRNVKWLVIVTGKQIGRAHV